MITAERLIGCDVLSRCQHCRFTQKWTALLNSWLSRKVDSCGEINSNISLTQFWAEVQSKEQNLSDLCWQATKTLLPFQTTNLCEAGFSALAMIKIKYRNQLQPEYDIRCALLTTDPNFDKLVMQVQGQGPH